MAVHIDDFGGMGRDLEPWADKRGYVPEIGDDPQQFMYEEPNDLYNPNTWAAFVQDAGRAISDAEDAIDLRMMQSIGHISLPRRIRVDGHVYERVDQT